MIPRRGGYGHERGRIPAGPPPAFDDETYRHRNTVERSFNRLKHWLGIATRYDNYALTYLGGLALAALVTHHRVRN